MKPIRTAGMLTVWLMFLPAGGWAQQQTGIVGSVRDATGGVVPGVTVEVASPALIERVRIGVTDGSGNYTIVDLGPGIYSVTFTLPGFRTFRREGVELTSGFTATVNAELTIGDLEETITVTGASPIVDIRSARSIPVLTEEVLQALPSGMRAFSNMVSLTLGASHGVRASNDVGGDKGEKHDGVLLHGSHSEDGRSNYDGMSTNMLNGRSGADSRVYKFNVVGVQEIVLDTSTNAENPFGGVTVDMIPKDGGNTFTLLGNANYTNSDLTTGKVPAKLLARGSADDQKSVKRVWDTGFGLGGPLVRDGLWFYTGHRYWGSQAFAANNFFNTNENPFLYIPDLSRPAFADQHIVDNGFRLTWQAAAKHKVTFSLNRQVACNCWLFLSAGANDAPQAASTTRVGKSEFGGNGVFLSQGTWTYPVTNQLLLQAGGSFMHQPVFRVSTDPPPPGSNRHATRELSTGYNYGGRSSGETSVDFGPLRNDNFEQRFSVSYVTGSHSAKVGVQTTIGHHQGPNSRVAPDSLTYRFRNEIPVDLTQWADPFLSKNEMRAVRLYAQDNWTINRLTVNYGLRYDHFWAYALPVTKPGGRFIDPISFPRLDDMPNYHDISPRLGFAYDLFGTGRTAIKGSWGHYLNAQGVGILQSLSPSNAVVPNTRRTWNDANANFNPDCDLLNFSANGECGAINNAAFGTVQVNTIWADDARKGWGQSQYSRQLSLELEHELRPGIGLRVGYFRTWFGNFQVTQNIAVSPSDFSPYCVTAPVDTRLPGGGGNQICGLFDVNPDAFGQVSNVRRRASDFGTPQELFNGVDIGFTAQVAEALFQGGVTLGRVSMDTCFLNDRPDVTLQGPRRRITDVREEEFCNFSQPLWDGVGSQIKLQAAVPLPWWDLELGAVYKNVPGATVSAAWTATNAQVAPSLGRNLSACPATGTCTATVTLPLIPIGNTTEREPYGTQFEERLNEIDLRLTKTFQIGETRLQAIAELWNVFNARPVQGIVSTFGGRWLTPTSILGGRLFKFGMQISL